MEGGSVPYNPRTVEEVFKDFRGRRAGMIKALTTDVEDFYQQCDPEDAWTHTYCCWTLRSMASPSAGLMADPRQRLRSLKLLVKEQEDASQTIYI